MREETCLRQDDQRRTSEWVTLRRSLHRVSGKVRGTGYAKALKERRALKVLSNRVRVVGAQTKEDRD